MRRAAYLLSGMLILLLAAPSSWAFDRGGSFTLQVNKAGTGTGTVTSNPSGINCGSTCSARFSSGATVTLMATPAAGSVFAGWSGSGCTGTGNCTVTLTANTTVTATFNTSGGGGGGTFTLAILKNGDGKGTVSSDPAGIDCGSTCSASFPAGTSVTLFAGATTGEFTGWSGGACSGSSQSCTLTLNANTTVTATFTIPTLTITTTTMPDGNVGANYSAFITSSGGSGSPHKFRIISGQLPSGLTMAESFGVQSTIVSGNPTRTGTSAFTVEVRDGTGHTDTQDLSITINGPTPLVITMPGPTAVSGTVGAAYSQNLFASGGKTPYFWSSTGGQLPPGLRFVSASNSNRIEGTPTTRGTFTFTLTVTDSGSPSQTTSQQTSITIN